MAVKLLRRTGLSVLPIVAAMAFVACGGEVGDSDLIKFPAAGAATQTVTFQKPEAPGPDPFTEAADVKGRKRVQLPEGQGPYGGTGSDRVCDRDVLIRSLKRHPDRLRAWAGVLGIKPTFKAVSRYIAKLHPVTLTRDTQVTNHSFVNGRAVAFQSILQAGTAVLVDKFGRPVVRCRCGNPLLEPIYVKQAKCIGCPPNYQPPPSCDFYSRRRDYDRTYYRRDYYSNGDFDEVFVRRHRRSGLADCYLPYPDPPVVRITDVYREPPPVRPPVTRTAPAPSTGGLQCDPPRSQLEFEQCAAQDARGAPPPEADNGPPRASFSPSAGTAADTYTLNVAGFNPNTPLQFTLTRPDGVSEDYSLTTSEDGSGSYTFPRVENPVLGTYTAAIHDPATGESTTASVTVSG